MASKRRAPAWRAAFLRALARSANVRVAAREAGVDHSSAYALRKRDAEFAERWEKALRRGSGQALAKAKAALPPPLHQPSPRGYGRSPSPANAGEELVLRRSKNAGAQLVRAGAGRWSAKAEKAFLGELARTGCVRWAAEAAGFSTTALYNRRDSDPDFAARWRGIEERAKARLHSLVVQAGLATFDPELEGEGLPKVTIAEAIKILQLKGPSTAPATGGEKGQRYMPKEPSIEEVRENILRKLDAIEAAERRKESE